MIKKILSDGTKVTSVNHAKQEAKENLTDMLAGFFDSKNLRKDDLERICLECLEIADTSYDFIAIAEVYYFALNQQETALKLYKEARKIAKTIDEFAFITYFKELLVEPSVTK